MGNDKNYWMDWKLWAGAALGVSLFFVLFWSIAIACVVFGGGPEVCGL